MEDIIDKFSIILSKPTEKKPAKDKCLYNLYIFCWNLLFLAHDFNNQFDIKRNIEDTIDKSFVVHYKTTEKIVEKGERKKIFPIFCWYRFFLADDFENPLEFL